MSESDAVLHDLEQLKKQAKSLLKTARTSAPKAISQFAKYGLLVQNHADLKLADAQLVIARERGFESWRKLRDFIEENVANTFFEALNQGKIRKVKLLLREYPALIHARDARSGLLPIQLTVQQEQHALTRLLFALEKPKRVDHSDYETQGPFNGQEMWSMINAAFTGDLETIKTLVKRHPKIVNCDYDYQSPLHLAIVNQHAHVVEFLIEQGADITSVNYQFNDSLITSALDRQSKPIQTLLVDALTKRFPYFQTGKHRILEVMKQQDWETVEHILTHHDTSQSFNICDETGMTPLHHAVKARQHDIVKTLIEKGADPNAIDKEGFKPIHHAFFKNTYWADGQRDIALATYLRNHGTDYNINLAALFGDDKGVLKFLNEDAALANFNDTCDKRPLSSAAANGDETIVKLLLEFGADPMLPETNAPKGHALFVAAKKNHPKIVQLLLDAGADPNSPVHASGTAFTIGKKHKEVIAVFKQFADSPKDSRPTLSEGSDPMVTAIFDNDIERVRHYLDQNPALATDHDAFYGEGYLAIAANRKFMDIIELLLERGATIPDESNWGTAYSFKHTDIARLFLENGANPNHCNWLKRTILHVFAYQGDLEKVKLLLEFGAHIDPIDLEYRSTPLGFAARAGQLEMVRFLIQAGANPTLPESPSWARPLAWAKSRGHKEVEAMLSSFR